MKRIAEVIRNSQCSQHHSGSLPVYRAMNVVSAILVFLLLSSFNLPAQESNTVLGLINEYNEATSDQASQLRRRPISIRSALPHDLLDPAIGMESFSIGISDPAVDSATGFRQAYIRALMLLALQKSCIVKVVTENFASVNESDHGVNSKFEELFEVRGEIMVNDTYPVVSYTRLSSGETVLLIGGPDVISDISTSTHDVDSSVSDFPQSPELNRSSNSLSEISDGVPTRDDKMMMEVSCRLYHLETMTQRGQQVFRTEYDSRGVDSLAFTDHEKFIHASVNGRWCKMSAFFNGNEIPRTDAKYFYYTKGVDSPGDSAFQKSTARVTIDGLWPALVTSVLWQLTGANTDGTASSIKQVSDYYNETHRNLSRTSEVHAVRFGLQKVVPLNGQLYSIITYETMNYDK